jgi:hypothetical protein
MIRNYLAVYIGFSYSSGNQLGILRAEIKDQYFFRHGCEDSQFIFFLAIAEGGSNLLKLFDFVTSIGTLIGLPLQVYPEFIEGLHSGFSSLFSS